ncbi:uncharacterized protein LOC129723060 [Wyeomyia smithii]|uniref:uncharacterized protein LOC129723060 n=1 Tax=Wyeomyia smithii TaxID=174621 RepID=UPI002467D610|nr:uncharacterized protein LOC129723060 [Wyeomyia smithii]
MIHFLLMGQFLLFLCKAQRDREPIEQKPLAEFSGYDYPKPSITFEDGYVYNKPSCPLVLPSTQYVTLPPVVSVQLHTTTHTETVVQTLIATSTDYLTVTSTKFNCAPSTYLSPPPTSPNTYLPVGKPTNTYLPKLRVDIEQTTPNSFLQSYDYSQAAPIKRMIDDFTANTLDDHLSVALHSPIGQDNSTTTTQLPTAVNIIYLDRRTAEDTSSGPPADLLSWLLCRFNLVNKTCENQ